LPMVPSLRKGLWQQLEMQVRVSLSKPNRQQLFILTGPIYQNGKTLGMIGKNGVPIPTHYYKILVDPDTDGSLTYIIPNQNILTPGYTGDKKNLFTCNGGACDLNNFISSVKEAERLTGFTFYPKLAPQYATKVKLDASEYLKKRETNLK
jgi:endonuclease G